MSIANNIKNIVRRIVGRNPKDENGIEYVGKRKPNISIGEGSYFNGAKVYSFNITMKISIGKYCSFADGLKIVGGGEHTLKWVSTWPFINNWKLIECYDLRESNCKGDIIIGNDVWCGTDVTILSGVSIGNGAVIAAGAVVVADIPSYAIVGGVPAKMIKYRFEQEICERLDKIQWWNWEKKVIAERIRDFTKPEEFIQKYYR